MNMFHLFNELSQKNRDRAKAMFIDAKPYDGFLYELDMDGKVICRKRGPFEPMKKTRTTR